MWNKTAIPKNVHEIRYAYNKALNMYRATCSCGWLSCDYRLDTLTARATGHDLWEPLKEVENGEQVKQD